MHKSEIRIKAANELQTKMSRCNLGLTIIITFTYISAIDGNDDKSSVLQNCLRERGTPSEVFVAKSSVLYKELNYQFDNGKPIAYPLAIMAVRNSKDVSDIIRCTKELGIRVVAKSGGHSFEKYSYGDSSTVVIDLGNLNTIRINKLDKTASVGTGVLQGLLYWKIWNEGKFGLPGGDYLGVGAGIMLGGGMGNLAKQFGLTCDNVLDMEIVVANGDVLTANKYSNPDLFWALRGAGGGNFGIVTLINYKLFDASHMNWSNIHLTYTISKFNPVFKAWDTWNARIQNETISTRFSVSSEGITIMIVTESSAVNRVKNDIKNYFPQQYSNLVVEVPLSFFQIVSPDLSHVKEIKLGNLKRKDAMKKGIWHKSYYANEIVGTESIEKLGSMLSIIPEGVEISLESYGGAVNQVKKDATAFVHRNALYEFDISRDAMRDNDSAGNKWWEEFNNIVTDTLDNGESYQNHIDGGLENYERRYYGSNLERLVQIKKEIDPDNFFHFRQAIPSDLAIGGGVMKNVTNKKIIYICYLVFVTVFTYYDD